jgi:hypothetical protein
MRIENRLAPNHRPGVDAGRARCLHIARGWLGALSIQLEEFK